MLFDVRSWNLKETKVVPDNKTIKNKHKKRSFDGLKKEDQKDEEIDNPVSTEQVKSQLKPLKKKKINNPNQKSNTLTALQQKMKDKLSGARFRWINEKLYSLSSSEAFELVRKDPEILEIYHSGFAKQVATWPQNPVDLFFDQIVSRSTKTFVNAIGGLVALPDKTVVIADMGCGDAALALSVKNYLKSPSNSRKIKIKIHSFDLVAYNERITVANLKNVPLPDSSTSIVIFCLSLMGSDFLSFIQEAKRILIERGELWIAEIKSRFTTEKSNSSKSNPYQKFISVLSLYGFKHRFTLDDNNVFVIFEFFRYSVPSKLKKKSNPSDNNSFDLKLLEKQIKESSEGTWLLKPSLYKKR